MKRTNIHLILLCATLCFAGTASAATTLINDTFQAGSSTALNGSTPDTTTGGATWTALSSLTYTGGTLTIPSSVTAETAYLNLGANYFSSNPGTYTLSMTLNIPTGSSTSWVGLGFFEPTIASSSNATNNAGAPLFFLRQNGAYVIQSLTATANGGTALTALSGSGATNGQDNTLQLVLNTSAASWTLDGYLNGTQLDLNGASAGLTYTYGTNPTSIQYVGFGSSIGGNAFSATVTDFSLTTSVPEPASLALLLLGMVVTWKGIRVRSRRA